MEKFKLDAKEKNRKNREKVSKILNKAKEALTLAVDQNDDV